MDAPGAPTLTEKTSPGHGVEVLLAELDSDAATATCWRVSDGGREAVRGALRVPVSGDLVVTDWEVPNGVESTYVVEIFDAGGASILGAPSSITVAWSGVVFSNPVDPEQQFAVKLKVPSLIGTERGVNNRRIHVVGIPRPFNQWWGEGALQNIPLEVWSRGDEDTANLKSLSSAGQWLIRTPPRYVTLPRLLYVSLQPPRHEYLAFWTDDNPIRWVLIVDEVQPISKAILRPLVTWDDWITAFPSDTYTWDDVLAIYSAGTWTDAVRNPPDA